MPRRKKGDEGEHLTAAITVQMTPSERDELRKRAGKNVSGYARRRLLGRAPKQQVVEPKDVRAIEVQLRRVGTNLNQLATRANEDRLKGERFRSDDKLAACLVDVKQALAAVISGWKDGEKR